MKLIHFIGYLFSFLCLFCFQAFSWNVSPECFDGKPPAWMQQTIERDLSFFQQGVHTHEIALCLQRLKGIQGIEKAGLVHIQFVRAEATYAPLFPLSTEQTSALNHFLSALNHLPLPDFDLILSVSPSFDRPFLLLHTTVPIFAVSKECHNHKVVLIPRLWNSEREALFHHLPDWETKTAKAFWRGFATDTPYGFYDWDCKPRSRLVLESLHHPDLLDAAIVASPHLDAYLLKWLDSLSYLAPFTPPEQQCAYKYLISIDGSASPSTFEWQLFSHSLLFKAESNRVEWFYDALLQDQHFLSFHPGGNDLIEKISWAITHDEEAFAMAKRARLFAEEHLRDEDLFVYLYHLLSTYSKLQRM